MQGKTKQNQTETKKTQPKQNRIVKQQDKVSVGLRNLTLSNLTQCVAQQMENKD